MARYTYADSPHNATLDWKIETALDHDKEEMYYYVSVPVACDCGCPGCKAIKYRPHTNGMRFPEHENAAKWIESIQEFLDNDYEDYANENSHAIAQMERYEQFRNEY